MFIKRFLNRFVLGHYHGKGISYAVGRGRSISLCIHTWTYWQKLRLDEPDAPALKWVGKTVTEVTDETRTSYTFFPFVFRTHDFR